MEGRVFLHQTSSSDSSPAPLASYGQNQGQMYPQQAYQSNSGPSAANNLGMVMQRIDGELKTFNLRLTAIEQQISLIGKQISIGNNAFNFNSLAPLVNDIVLKNNINLMNFVKKAVEESTMKLNEIIIRNFHQSDIQARKDSIFPRIIGSSEDNLFQTFGMDEFNAMENIDTAPPGLGASQINDRRLPTHRSSSFSRSRASNRGSVSSGLNEPIHSQNPLAFNQFSFLKSFGRIHSDFDMDLDLDLTIDDDKTIASTTNGKTVSSVAPFEPFLSLEQVTNGLQDGSLFIGVLKINPSNRQEATVHLDLDDNHQKLDYSKVLILGEKFRNRSLENDHVVISLLPITQWEKSERHERKTIKYKSVDVFEAAKDFWRPDPSLIQMNILNENETIEEPESISENENPNPSLSFAAVAGKGISVKKQDSSDMMSTSLDHNPSMGLIPTGKVVALLNEDRSQGLRTRNVTKQLDQPLVGFLVPRYGFENPKLIKNEPLPKSENTVEFRPLDHRFPFLMIQREDLPKEFISNPFSFKSPNEKLVKCSIKGWFENFRFPLGKFHTILGESYNIEAETEAVIVGNDFLLNSEAFSDEVIKEISKLKVPNLTKELTNRKDFRSEFLFTFSNADNDVNTICFHCKKVNISEDNVVFECGVHVVDVSFFVHENTVLDLEAFNRGADVQLVHKHFPLLPPSLLKLCSFNADSKLAFSCVFYLSSKGEFISDKTRYYFAKSVVNNIHVVNMNENNMEMQENVKLFLTLSKARLNFRLSTGNGVLLKKSRLLFSNDSNVVSMLQSDTSVLIEEMESLANYFAAEKLLKESKHYALLVKQAPPTFYEDDFAFILQIMKLFGLPNNGNNDELTLDANSFQKVFDNIALKRTVEITQQALQRLPPQHAALLNVLRVVQQSILKLSGNVAKKLFVHLFSECLSSPEFIVVEGHGNKFHSGQSSKNCHFWELNAPYYSGFTSPTKNYADITVHRLLNLCLQNSSNNHAAFKNDYLSELKEKLTVIAEHCNQKLKDAFVARKESEMVFLCSLVKQRKEKEKVFSNAIVVHFGWKHMKLFLVDLNMTCKVNLFVDWQAEHVSTHYHDGHVLAHKHNNNDIPSKEKLNKAKEKVALSLSVKLPNMKDPIELKFGSEIRLSLKPQMERKRILGFRTDFVSMIA